MSKIPNPPVSAYELVIASANVGKLAELTELLSDLPFRLFPQDALGVSAIEETGHTFIENALLKARHACLCTNKPALADDSGLIVDALQGAPGLYSARYAGAQRNDDANNAKLLEAMQHVPTPLRTARLYSVVVYMRHAYDPQPYVAEATWEGSITTTPQGRLGFGYNPVFLDPNLGLTVAQMDAQTRRRLSHRARAFAQLRERLVLLAQSTPVLSS